MKKENIEFFRGIESIIAIKPPKLLWLIPLMIGGLFLFIMLWLSLSQIDVIAPSTGKIIPSSKMILIQAKDTSIIEKVHVKNGQNVKKGDLLITLRNSEEKFDNVTMKTKYEILLQKKEFLEKFIEYMNNIQFKDLNLSSSDFINAKFISYISSFNTEIDSFNSKIEFLDYKTG